MARTQVQAELIAANALTATLIPDGTLTATQLAANCVDSAELVTGSIDTIHIAANNVTAAKIASNSILTRHIQDDQISGDQLTNNISIAGTLDVAGAVTFNEGSNDVDFRVESNGNANMLLVDAGGDSVQVGTTTNTYNAALVVNNEAGEVGFNVTDGTTHVATWATGTLGTIGTRSNHDLAFKANDSEKFRFTTDGEIGIGGTNYGTDGQVLTSAGAGAAAAWEDVAGGPTHKTFGTGSIMVGDSTTGTINAANNNTGLGVDIFATLTTGDANTAIGGEALYTNAVGSSNVAVGYRALKAQNSYSNTAVGAYAGQGITTGQQNVAVGTYALDSASIGSHNSTAVGYQALGANTAANNTAIGSEAGDEWTTNGNNVALGYHAANTVGTVATQGIWIGSEAGSTEAIDGTKTGQTVIGANAHCGNVEQVVVIGKNMNSVGTNWISIGHSDDARVSINDSSGTAWTYPSDERMKENIADMPASAGLSFIKTLKPRTFTWRKKEDYDTSLVALRGKIQQEGDTTKKAEGTQYGFIAQEAKTAMEAAGLTADNDGGGYGFWTRDISSGSGGMQGVSKEDLIPSLVKAIQELETRLAALE